MSASFGSRESSNPTNRPTVKTRVDQRPSWDRCPSAIAGCIRHCSANGDPRRAAARFNRSATSDCPALLFGSFDALASVPARPIAVRRRPSLLTSEPIRVGAQLAECRCGTLHPLSRRKTRSPLNLSESERLSTGGGLARAESRRPPLERSRSPLTCNAAPVNAARSAIYGQSPARRALLGLPTHGATTQPSAEAVKGQAAHEGRALELVMGWTARDASQAPRRTGARRRRLNRVEGQRAARKVPLGDRRPPPGHATD